MRIDEVGGLGEHAARSASGIEDGAAVGLDDLDHHPDDGARGEELSPALTFGQREFADEVFVNLAEDVAAGVVRDVVELAEQIEGQTLGFHRPGEPVVFILGQTARELRLEFLDGGHGRFKSLGDILILREIEKVAVAGMLRKVEATLGDGDLVERFFAAGALEFLEFRLNRLLMAAVVDVGEFEEDQAENRSAILGRAEIGIGTELVGGGPEVIFESLELVAGHLV